MKSFFLLKNPFLAICFGCALVGSLSTVSAINPTKAPKATKLSPLPTSEPSNKPFLRPSAGPTAQESWAVQSEVPTNVTTTAPTPGPTVVSPAPSLSSCYVEVSFEPECPDIDCAGDDGCNDTYIYPEINFNLDLEDEMDVLELDLLLVVVLPPDGSSILPQTFEPSVTGVTISPSFNESTQLNMTWDEEFTVIFTISGELNGTACADLSYSTIACRT